MRTYREGARDLPVSGETDVLVCGGGPAGVAAAIAAARAGVRTRLLELQGCLGGIWTSGLVSWVIDSDNKAGVMREIAGRLDARGARRGSRRDYAYEPEVMKLVLEEMCVEAGVELQFHTRVVAAAADSEGKVSVAITESGSGRQAWAARAFVDATGNGDLAALLGCQYVVGREGSDDAQPMSLLCLVSGPEPTEVSEFVCWPDKGHREAKDALLREMARADAVPSYSAPTLMHLGGRLYVLSTNHEYGCSGMDASVITQATVAARGELHRLVGALRSLGGVWRDLRLVASGNHIGIRDGRRIRGLYEVTVDDLLRGATHDDAVCRVTVGIDVHSTDPTTTKSYSEENRVRTLPYDIPLRALIARDVRGVLLAGRCISGDFLAHASYRMTATAAATGQAAGTLAALAAVRGEMPEDVPWSAVRGALDKLEGATA